MIFTIFYLINTLILKGVYAILPPIEDSYIDGLTSALGELKHYWSMWNTYVDMDTFLSLAKWLIGIQIILFAFKTFNWAYNKLRGSG